MFVIQCERRINTIICVFLNTFHYLLPAMIYKGLGMGRATGQQLSITLFLTTR